MKRFIHPFQLLTFTVIQSVLVASFDPGCSRPLGLSTGEIKDWQISGSSLRPFHHPHVEFKYARLYSPHGRCWCPNVNDLEMSINNRSQEEKEWIFIDLGFQETAISGISIQGRGGRFNEWVTEFNVALSDDAYEWKVIQNSMGDAKIFRGNQDTSSIRNVWFESVQYGRFVKLIIVNWRNYPCLRFEILGCQECGEIISGAKYSTTFSSKAMDSICDESNAHIYSHEGCTLNKNGNPYLDIDIGSPTKITAIKTKGKGPKKEWMTSYTLTYSNDSHIWYYYRETNHIAQKIFQGNMDRNTERSHFLNNPFVARIIRIHPKSWRNQIGLRVGLFGCPRKECREDFFRMNQYSACIENLAWRRQIWSNDKRHSHKNWKHGHISLAVDGKEDIILPNCAILHNYYTESPVLMIDLGRPREINGVVILTWQGDGQDKMITYKDFVLNLEQLIVFVSKRPELDSQELELEPKCGNLTNPQIFNPRLHFECANGGRNGRYVYIQANQMAKMQNKMFNMILCEVYVY